MFENFHHSQVKLGKRWVRHDQRTFRLDAYMATDIPPAPPILDWYKGTTVWGMMLNDRLGCCTISSKGHALQVASVNTSGMITISDPEVETYYEQWDGYVHGNPNSDQGGIILDVLNNWHKHRMIGHRLLAFTSVNPLNFEHIKKAIELFGVVDLGLQLPVSAQSQIGTLWDVVGGPESEPGSWGGHDVTIGKYETLSDGEIIFDVITWGGIQRMTGRFLQKYCDELYALLLGMWLDNQPTAPSGFSRDQLMQDARLFAN